MVAEMRSVFHLSCNWGHDPPDHWNPPEDGAGTGGNHIFSHSLAKAGGVLL